MIQTEQRMMLFFQIVGAFLLALVILVLALLFWLRWRLRRLGNELSNAFKSLGDVKPEPSQINLDPIDEPEWASETQARMQIEKLRKRGFVDERFYRIRQTPAVELWAGVHPSACVYAALFRHPLQGTWVDLVSAYEDGRWATFSNSPQSGLDRPPGKPIHRFAEFDADQLFERMLRDRPDAPMKPATSEQFAASLEQYHAEEMAWRNSRGGPTEREIRAVAAASGQVLDDDTLGLAKQLMSEQSRIQLIEALRDQFIRETTLTAAEWEMVRDRLAFVYDGMSPEEVSGLIGAFIEDQDDVEDGDHVAAVPEYPTDLSARDAFRVMNDRLPEELKFRRVDAVSKPVAADVYAAPREL
jgi:hypothetical protein